MKERIYGLTKVLALCLIVSLGMCLRSYILNFPSIGYHNMIENEYLTTAQEMNTAHDYSLNRMHCYNIFEEPVHRYYSQPPLISYQILLAWRLFDENLWGPRLFNVLFGAFSILGIYFIASILFRNIFLSLFASFSLAIMPLAVFFSRNIQPESPAFFFMILANLFYLRFASSFKKYNLFFSGLSLSAACLYKFNFFITVIPFIFCFPFKIFFNNRKEFLKILFVFCLSILPIVTAIIWLSFLNRWDFQELHKIRSFSIFTSSYWAEHGRTIWWYTKQENFSVIYVALTLLGIITAFLKRRGLLNRYIIGWGLAVICYGIMYSEYIYQNNFSQMPFLLLASVSTGYAVLYISLVLKKIFTKDLFLPLILMTVAISIPFAYNSILRMYATAFLGVDVAGESLREFTRPNEYIFLSTHAQGYGIVRYSRRLAGWVDELAGFKDKEKEFDIKYICFYPIENLMRLKFSSLPLYEYIQKNYRIKEVGLTDEPFKLYYIIFEKGEGVDIEKSLGSLSGIKRIQAIYKSFDMYVIFYSLRPLIGKPEDTR